MSEMERLAAQFEENRGHLRAVAYRMLGSAAEAEDAVQETWLKLSRSEAGRIENLPGWLTTVVARVCLDLLRSRSSRREEGEGVQMPETAAAGGNALDPEKEALLAESVGLALMVVLQRLEPAERLAFVLHDTFAVPFDEIAPIVGRSEPAVRQLASRARRRVRGTATVPPAELASQKKVVDEFLLALRNADFDGLLAVLDPDIVVRTPGPDGVREIRGASAWAKGAVVFAKQARFIAPALVDGAPGLVLAHGSRLLRVVRFVIAAGKIVSGEIIAEPERLRLLDLAVFEAD